MNQMKSVQPRVGQEVYSCDGALLGAVSQVWPPARDHRERSSPLLERLPGHPMPEPATGPHGPWQPYDEGYLELDRGTQGEDRYIYVPFGAIKEQTDDFLILDVREADVPQQGWMIKPHFLQ